MNVRRGAGFLGAPQDVFVAPVLVLDLSTLISSPNRAFSKSVLYT